MKPTKPRLGRGLEALFGELGSAIISDQRSRIVVDKVWNLQLNLIHPNSFQPRINFDSKLLEELAASIRIQGILQPILVRPSPAIIGMFEIIAGERRWRAATLAKLHDVPVICRPMSDAESAAAALIENLQRENLNPIEEAEGYKRIIKTFGLTQDALGSAVGKSRGHVGNTIRLLNLNVEIQDKIRNGAISLGHARAILTVSNPELVVNEIIKRSLSVRQTERLVQRLEQAKLGTNDMYSIPNHNTTSKDLAARSGYRVRIVTAYKGDGSVTIRFNDLFQLDEIISRLTQDMIVQ